MTLSIINNGLRIDGGLRYAWFKLNYTGVGDFYRCIALKELSEIPVTVREDYDLLGKQWAAVRGLHNAGVNFAYAAMGIYDPDHIGIVQYFGAAAEGLSEKEAASKALDGMATVEAVLANFPQSKLASPTAEWFEWYLDFITRRSKNVAAILGHPDPRQGKRGAGGDGTPGDDSDSDLAQEQNEILFRGLAKLRKNFIYQVLAEHISRGEMAETLVRIAEITSNVASRRRGSISYGFNLSIPLMAAVAQSQQAGVSQGEGVAHSVQDGYSEGWGESHGVGLSEADGVAHSQGTSESWTEGTSKGTSVSDGTSESNGSSSTSGSGQSSGGGWSQSSGWGVNVDAGKSILGNIPVIGGLLKGVSGGYNQSSSVSGFGSTSSFSSHSSSHSTGTSHSEGSSKGESQSHSHGTFSSTTKSHTEGRSESWGESQNQGRSHGEGVGVSSMAGRISGQGLVGGLSTGLLPGISINRSFQTEDDVADRVTEVLRGLESLVNQATAEGGFMTNAFVFTEDNEGAAAADALVPQAFHGVSVPTPVLTLHPLKEEEDALRTHALSFTPWIEADEGDPFGGQLWTRYATLMTAGQLAALTAPGLFEEGAASTVMAEIPEGMGFYPNMPGDIILGHQYSPETADLTTAQVRLDFPNLMHTMFAGDTGFGKSVAAMRMLYETTLKHQTRSVVLDFGAGWRTMLNAPGLEGHLDIQQLWPDAVRPFRWNPLQIGRHISPETQWRAFADVFGGITQLGVKRQKQELLDSLRKLYVSHGVLIDDPDVRSDPQWGRVQAGDESNLTGVNAGLPLGNLPTKERQKLAVYRSAGVGLADLYQTIKERLETVPPRDTMLTGVLEGILFRMNPLVQGAASKQFAPGKDTVPVEDMSKPWGITIIEGGMFLDEFGKAFLLGWTGWHLYMDMVARRVHEVRDEPLLQIVYEEANKIFSKPEKNESGTDIAEQFGAQFRDGRKYGARFYVVSQAPSMIAQDIISSCTNITIGFLKNPDDKDLVMSALARSEKGFRDEEWRRFLDDIPIGMAIGRYPYTMDRRMQRPVLFRPLMLDVPEPSDADIEATLGGITLHD
jgi:hypothetical protein